MGVTDFIKKHETLEITSVPVALGVVGAAFGMPQYLIPSTAIGIYGIHEWRQEKKNSERRKQGALNQAGV